MDTHALLIEYQDVIAPDPDDRLNILLDDLGEVPSVAHLASRDLNSVSFYHQKKYLKIKMIIMSFI